MTLCFAGYTFFHLADTELNLARIDMKVSRNNTTKMTIILDSVLQRRCYKDNNTTLDMTNTKEFRIK